MRACDFRQDAVAAITSSRYHPGLALGPGAPTDARGVQRGAAAEAGKRGIQSVARVNVHVIRILRTLDVAENSLSCCFG